MTNHTPHESSSPKWAYSHEPQTGAEYINCIGKIGRGEVAETKQLRENLLIDLDESGHIIGVEILDLVPHESEEVEKILEEFYAKFYSLKAVWSDEKHAYLWPITEVETWLRSKLTPLVAPKEGCNCPMYHEKPHPPHGRGIKVGPPPIHEHWNEDKQQPELCGKVFCPKGFVGITPQPHTVPVEEELRRKVEKILWKHYNDGGYSMNGEQASEEIVELIASAREEGRQSASGWIVKWKEGYDDGFEAGRLKGIEELREKIESALVKFPQLDKWLDVVKNGNKDDAYVCGYNMAKADILFLLTPSDKNI